MRHKVIISSLFIATILLISSVFASFSFAGKCEEKEEFFVIEINKFQFEAEVTEEVKNSINKIVNDTAEGLNNRRSDLNQNLRERTQGKIFGWAARDTLGSMDPNAEDYSNLLSEGTTAFILAPQTQGNITNQNYTTMYLYTTTVDLGESGRSSGGLFPSNTQKGQPTTPIGEYVSPIYRTKLIRANSNAKWQMGDTEVGKAKSAWYEESREFTPTATQIPSFDVDTWEKI